MENRPISQSGTQNTGGTTEILGSRFRTQFKPDNHNDDEWNESPSKTVPDQTLTVQELLLNHSRGINSEVYDNEGQYLGDIEIPRITDLNDLIEHRQDLERQFQELEERLQAEQKQKEDENQTNNRGITDVNPSNPSDNREGREGDKESRIKE